METDRIPVSGSVELFTRRYPWLAPVCWLLTIQYFVAQIAVALATRSLYNWGTDPISYLGISPCGLFNSEYVCSPLAAVFNLSVIGLGVTMAAGAFLFYHQFRKSPGTLFGFGVIIVAGVGSLLAGVFPTDTVASVHRVGSGLSFVGGLVGVFALSISLRGLPRVLRYVMVTSGAVAVAGLVLLSLIFFLGIGFKGAAERITSYPQILWLVAFGAYIVIRQRATFLPWLKAEEQRRR